MTDKKAVGTKPFKPDISQQNGPAQFPEPTDVGPRAWGQEIMLVTSPGNYTFKLLKMKKGAKGGLQYHHRKFEAGYIIRGKLLVRYDPGTGKIAERLCEEGDVVYFPQGAVHQEEAITDVEIIEVSTPFLNDRVRVEKLYGLPEEGEGMPTTQPVEVQAL